MHKSIGTQLHPSMVNPNRLSNKTGFRDIRFTRVIP